MPDTPTIDASVIPGEPTDPGLVVSDDQTCSLAAGDLCCVTEVPTLLAEGAFNCQPPEAPRAMQLGCDSSDDCPAGQQCCLDGSTDPPASTCTTNYTASSTIDLECSAPIDCPQGAVCCGLETFVPGTVSRYGALRCMSTCSQTDGNIFCASDADRPLASTTCGRSNQVPGHTVCRTDEVVGGQWW